MTVSVHLPQLPPGVQFPSDMQERLHYEAATGELKFNGFMSKNTYDRLAALHPDWQYQRALEQLFRKSAEAAAATQRPRFSLRKLFFVNS